MGRLFVVATPIGNLSDLTPRARDTLRTVPVVFAEDTRVTLALLRAIDAHPRLLSYREANHQRATAQVLQALATSDVALVSDAGTPAIADPGQRLVDAVRAAGFKVEAIAGPSAVATALSVSGLWAGRWSFVGFLPNRPAARRAELTRWGQREDTMVVFEAPHRIHASLADLDELLPQRRIALLIELTKLHERVLRGSAAEVLALLGAEARGEMVLVVEGGPDSAVASSPADLEVGDVAAAARALGVDRRALYRFVVAERSRSHTST